MPDTQVLVSDYSLNRACSLYSGVLDSTATVRLFKNNWTQTNNQAIGQFSECTFAGYAGIALAGKSRGVRQLAIGVWELQFGQFYFSATGGPSQYINGWYLTDAASNVIAAQKLPAPRLVTNGLVFAVLIRIQFRALNLGCP